VRVSASAHSSWISSEFAFWNAEEKRRRQERRIRECACMLDCSITVEVSAFVWFVAFSHFLQACLDVAVLHFASGPCGLSLLKYSQRGSYTLANASMDCMAGLLDWGIGNVRERNGSISTPKSRTQRSHAYRAEGRKSNPNPNPLSIMQVVLDRCSENPRPCRRRDAWLNESKIDTRGEYQAYPPCSIAI